MLTPTSDFELLGNCRSWLLNEGFQCAPWPLLGEVLYKNQDMNPDQLPGAKLVVFTTPDSVTNPSILRSESAQIFHQAEEFFRKKHRMIGSADTFLLFIIFPVASLQADSVVYIEKNKPSATSFKGSLVPILLDMDRRSLHFFTPSFSSQTSGRSSLTDLVEWLFGLPLLPEGNILEQATGIVNSLRSIPTASPDETISDPRKISFDKLRSLANQLYYEGSTIEDRSSVRKLLFSFYLSEYCLLLQSSNTSQPTRRNDTLDLASFTSLDQFVEDVATSLARTMASGFRQGFASALRDGEAADRKKQLIKSGRVLSMAFCNNCKEVVTLTSDGRCPQGAFHSVESPTYFEINEEQEIQSFRATRRSK